MNIFTGLMTFVTIWTLVLFMILPLGVRTPADLGQKPEAGHATSAPVNPRIKFKMMLTTVIAVAVFAAYYFIQKYDLLGIGQLIR